MQAELENTDCAFLFVFRFPRYVNEYVCKDAVSGTYKNVHCLASEGMCKQNKIYMEFLKRDGCQMVEQDGKKVNVEKWVLTQEEVRTSCECQLSEHSAIVDEYIKGKKKPIVVG